MKYPFEIEKELWLRFRTICVRIGTNAAAQLRILILEFIKKHEK